MINNGAIYIKARVLSIEADRLVKLGEGIRIIPLFCVNHAARIKCVGILRVERKGAIEGVFGAVESPQPQKGCAIIISFLGSGHLNGVDGRGGSAYGI